MWSSQYLVSDFAIDHHHLLKYLVSVERNLSNMFLLHLSPTILILPTKLPFLIVSAFWMYIGPINCLCAQYIVHCTMYSNLAMCIVHFELWIIYFEFCIVCILDCALCMYVGLLVTLGSTARCPSAPWFHCYLHIPYFLQLLLFVSFINTNRSMKYANGENRNFRRQLKLSSLKINLINPMPCHKIKRGRIRNHPNYFCTL